MAGAIWKIHAEMDFDALCVWGGPKCTYNTMVRFLNEKSANPATRSYQFGITGLAAQLPSRMTNETRVTVTIFELPVLLFKSTAQDRGYKGALETITRGFEPATWAVLVCFEGALLLLGYIFTIRFTGSFNPADTLLNILHNNGIKMNANDIRTKCRMYRASMQLIHIALTLVVAVAAVFYQVAEVNFIFTRVDEVLPKPLREFSDDELSEFSTVQKSALEYALAIAVDPNGTRFPKREFPWYGCMEGMECFRKLIDPEDSVRYFASIEVS